jgi:hypothetical protein
MNMGTGFGLRKLDIDMPRYDSQWAKYRDISKRDGNMICQRVESFTIIYINPPIGRCIVGLAAIYRMTRPERSCRAIAANNSNE